MQVSLAERLQQQTQLSRELGLTAEQQAAVVRIREQERNEVRTINQKRLTTKAKKESRVRETVEKRNQEIREILTPEQRAKLDQMMMKRAGDRDQVRDRDQTRTQTPPDE